MTLIHAGALLDRAPGHKYAGKLKFAELAPAEPLPRVATVRRWGDGLPDGFITSFVVPTAALRSAKGPLRFDDDMAAGLEWAQECVKALGARFAVVPTGSDVTTGQRDRDLLAAWFERFRAGLDCDLVWHPRGLWDPEIAEPFSRRLGVRLAFDPLEADPPPGPILYARLKALGARTRFTETLLLETLDTIGASEAEEAFVAIESPRSFKEASRLEELAQADQ